MKRTKWDNRWNEWRGLGPIEKDLGSYAQVVDQIAGHEEDLRRLTDAELAAAVSAARTLPADADRAQTLPGIFSLVREVAHRTIGLRPFDVQLIAAVALDQGKLVEMQTGEGKTLAAVLPAVVRALFGDRVHVLTFNDYLARRDANWMRPVYEAFGLRVGIIQEGMNQAERRDAYAADVTYSTAKEAGFDFLRDSLVTDSEDAVHRPFNFAIVDEADSILIDEARVPLVIAGERETSDADPYRIAALVAGLDDTVHMEQDEFGRNVHLTEIGTDYLETALQCGSLHDAHNSLLLAEVNQALHAHLLLHRDIDYIVRDGRILLVDEFTGRVVPDRRWPDGLQAALEAKERLTIQPGGRILASITLQHFLARYPTLCGMTATAQSAAYELSSFYNLRVVPIPPNRARIREDLPEVIFSHREAKEKALVKEIVRLHVRRRPVLVGTGSVQESEHLAAVLAKNRVSCQVLNAKNDEAEARVVAEAGAPGAVTISTNMAGRGTDIRLGGADESKRDLVVALGGLYVIGTNWHESRRIDDQLRGRAGRQGDPGTSRFFVSLEDSLMVRFGIDSLIPPKLRPPGKDVPISNPIIRREVSRLQRIVEGQNYEIRVTLARYSALIETQRAVFQAWRDTVLTGISEPSEFVIRFPERYSQLLAAVGAERLSDIERAVTLHHIDAVWADHLAFVSEVREGIHLVGIGGLNPLYEFHKQVAAAFETLKKTIEDQVVGTLAGLEVTNQGELDPKLPRPSSTWTYLVNDRALTELQQMLFGQGSSAFAAGAVLMTWPLLLLWAAWRRLSRNEE